MASTSLPIIDGYVVDQLTKLLRERGQTQRPPAATAKVLALIVKLNDHRPPLPFPTRPVIAAHLDISVPTVDVVLSQRQATDDIKIVTETKKGNVANRPSTIKVRYIIPNPEIAKCVHDAEAEVKKAGARANRSLKPKLQALIAVLTVTLHCCLSIGG
jgi:hypothetical protein